MTLCAVISGCNDFESIAEYSKAKQDFFSQFLDVSTGIPSADTFLDVINRLNPTQFEKAFTDWVLSLKGLDEDIIAIDGKTMRGTSDRMSGASAIHLVNAWSMANNLCFGQLRVSEKSNEITAIPKLLELLDIKGATITMDAMWCQTKIARQIVENEADYVVALKGNQGNLHADVKLFLTSEIKRAFKDKTAWLLPRSRGGSWSRRRAKSMGD